VLKGIGELIFADGSDDPLQACPEDALGQCEISQLQLYSLQEKKSA
jgi:hypothetical protein